MGWFCQYRKFFLSQRILTTDIELQSLSNLLVRNIDQTGDLNFDCILGEKLSVNKYKLSKIYKNYLRHFYLILHFYLKKKKKFKIAF